MLESPSVEGKLYESCNCVLSEDRMPSEDRNPNEICHAMSHAEQVSASTLSEMSEKISYPES